MSKIDGSENCNDSDGLGYYLIGEVDGILGENSRTDESVGMIAVIGSKLL